MKKPDQPGKLRMFWKSWRKDDFCKTMAGTAVSFGTTSLFALYHGYLGICYSSGWHKSIGVFYLLLTAIRGMILLTEKGNLALSGEKQHFRRYRTFRISAILLLMLDLALMPPIALMAVFAKPVNFGLIPAITMAAYTTYKITMASIHVRRQKRKPTGNVLIAELRTVNFIDALVSILTLQNTLIMVNEAKDSAHNMGSLSIVTSAGIYATIAGITIRMLWKGMKQARMLSPRPDEKPQRVNRV